MEYLNYVDLQYSRYMCLESNNIYKPRMFSVSVRIATWQRSRLRDTTIFNLMMYKSSLNFKEPPMVLDECDELVPEMVGKIPPKWENDWWKEKLYFEVRPTIM